MSPFLCEIKNHLTDFPGTPNWIARRKWSSRFLIKISGDHMDAEIPAKADQAKLVYQIST